MAIVLKRIFPSRTSSESDAPTSGNAKHFVLTACSLRGFLDFADTKRQKERRENESLRPAGDFLRPDDDTFPNPEEAEQWEDQS